MDDFVVAKINNEKVPIPIGLRRPKFKDFYAFEEWIAEELAYANKLKERLEAGEKLPHSIQQEMVNWSKRNWYNFKTNLKLTIEKILLSFDVKIKMSLRKEHYNLEKCLDLLKKLKRLHFTPRMLKNNPEIIKTIVRITRFRGKGLDRDEVRRVRKYGYSILEKMSDMSNVSNQQ